MSFLAALGAEGVGAAAAGEGAAVGAGAEEGLGSAAKLMNPTQFGPHGKMLSGATGLLSGLANALSGPGIGTVGDPEHDGHQ